MGGRLICGGELWSEDGGGMKRTEACEEEDKRAIF